MSCETVWSIKAVSDDVIGQDGPRRPRFRSRALVSSPSTSRDVMLMMTSPSPPVGIVSHVIGYDEYERNNVGEDDAMRRRHGTADEDDGRELNDVEVKSDLHEVA